MREVEHTVAEKMRGDFAVQKLLSFFLLKMAVFLHTVCLKVLLTNNVVSFEVLSH